MKRSSMQSKIPPAIREQLAEDPYMKSCILEGEECLGRIEWNHAFTYGGKRQNELWSLLPMCNFHHRVEAMYRIDIQLALLKRIRHFNALEYFRRKYPKSTLQGPEKR